MATIRYKKRQFLNSFTLFCYLDHAQVVRLLRTLSLHGEAFSVLSGHRDSCCRVSHGPSQAHGTGEYELCFRG